MSNNNTERPELTAAELDLVGGSGSFDAYLKIEGVIGRYAGGQQQFVYDVLPGSGK